MEDPQDGDQSRNPAGEAERPRIKVVDRRWWKQAEQEAGEAAGGEWQPGKPTYLEELERQIAEKDAQIQEFVGKYRGASREFDEARARLRREAAKEIERGRRALLVELLGVVDNLDRAIDAANASATVATLKEGVELVRRQFLATLEGFGVSRIDAEDAAFDPVEHDAISTVPTDDPARDGRVVGVISPGYRIGDDILRPAAVAVSKLRKADDDADRTQGPRS